MNRFFRSAAVSRALGFARTTAASNAARITARITASITDIVAATIAAPVAVPVGLLAAVLAAAPTARAFENDFTVAPAKSAASAPPPSRRNTINTRGFPSTPPTTRPGAVRPTTGAARPVSGASATNASSELPLPGATRTAPSLGSSATQPTSARPAPTFGSPTGAPATVPARRAVAPVAGGEQTVDLNALDSAPAAAPGRGGPGAGGMSAHGGGGAPSLGASLKFYFDFMYRSRLPNHPDSTPGFDSFHQLIMAEYAPTPEFQFVTELGSAVFNMGTVPKFFEFDYQITPKLQLRWGKIWIPFDDMNPHNIYGGRVNAANFLQNSALIILPTVWADLGLGFRYRLVEKSPYTFDVYGYIVNGFQQLGQDPIAPAGKAYPNFNTLGVPGTTAGDNNAAKDYGLRGQLKAGQQWSVGASYYKGTYSNKSLPETLGLSMIGIDAQYRPSNVTEVRVGYILTSFDLDKTLDVTSAKRAANYLEVAQKFSADRTWKAIFRTGQIQADDRAESTGDSRIVGGALQKNFGPITIGLEVSRDLKKVEGKSVYNFGALRIVTTL